jgi:hypothetical protein
MKRLLLLIVLCVLVAHLPASGMPDDGQDKESQADYHLQFADSLETAGSFQGAALVYKMVAELFPNSQHYANAVRNLGHLYINPFNPTRNDSIALYWFTRHLAITWLPRGERTRSVIISSMIRERMQVSSVDNRKSSIIDSLTSLARIQSAELNAQSKKIADLTSDLAQTDNDLQILLEFQKNPTVARRDTLNTSTNLNLPKIAEATDSPQVRKKSDQSTDQLQKLRDIDLRALQRRTKR